MPHLVSLIGWPHGALRVSDVIRRWLPLTFVGMSPSAERIYFAWFGVYETPHHKLWWVFAQADAIRSRRARRRMLARELARFRKPSRPDVTAAAATLRRVQRSDDPTLNTPAIREECERRLAAALGLAHLSGVRAFQLTDLIRVGRQVVRAMHRLVRRGGTPPAAVRLRQLVVVTGPRAPALSLTGTACASIAA